MAIVYPNHRIFIRPPLTNENLQTVLGGHDEPEYIKTVHPLQGGTYTVVAYAPYWRKGHPYPEAIQKNNEVKRITLTYLMPLVSWQLIPSLLIFLLVPRKWKFFEKVLANYNRLVWSIYDSAERNPILKEEYYNNLPKELWRFICCFLIQWKITPETSYDFGRIIATQIQYENVYYTRIADIFSLMDYQRLYKNPRKEINQAIGIYKDREHTLQEHSPGAKFIALAKIATLLLYLPKVKKTFRKALLKVDFKNFQLDEADRYFALNDPNYDVCGILWEKRKEEFEIIRQNYILSLIKKSMVTQAQIDKVTAALTPLYADPDFAGVTDMNVAVKQTPPVPVESVDQVDVVKP